MNEFYVTRRKHGKISFSAHVHEINEITDKMEMNWNDGMLIKQREG